MTLEKQGRRHSPLFLAAPRDCLTLPPRLLPDLTKQQQPCENQTNRQWLGTQTDLYLLDFLRDQNQSKANFGTNNVNWSKHWRKREHLFPSAKRQPWLNRWFGVSPSSHTHFLRLFPPRFSRDTTAHYRYDFVSISFQHRPLNLIFRLKVVRSGNKW